MAQKKRKLHITRLTALCLLLAICLSWAVPVRAADSGSCGEKAVWQITGGVLYVTGSGETDHYYAEAPAPWSAYAESITQVFVGEGITRLGQRAFDGCTNLVGVSLPSTLTEIGERAFRNCGKIESVRLPDGLKIIGEGAFEGCERLWGLRLPSGLETIRNFAFYRCGSLAAITVPESVYYFGMAVFGYCTKLTQATILCPLVRLPDSTFFGCTNLTIVSLPPTIEGLGQNVFHECPALTKIHYDGSNADEIIGELRQQEPDNSEVQIDSYGNPGGESYGYIPSDSETELGGETVKTRETENSTVSVIVETDSVILIDGVPVSPSDLTPEMLDPSQSSEPTNPEDPSEQAPQQSGGTKIEVSTNETVRIEATLTNDDGWEDVFGAIQNLRENEVEQFDVKINLPGSTVSGSALSKVAGQNVQLTTNTGAVWEISPENARPNYRKTNYDLGITVTQVDPKKSPVESDTVYKVNFAGDIDFNATVGIHVGNPREVATLYQKVGKEYRTVQTVIVDGNGTAWFDLAGTTAKSDFYVSINDANADRDNATIPKTLYEEYGMTSGGATLMDASGKYYEVVGVNSLLGLDLKTFTMYVGVALVAVILVVTIVMVSLNQSKKMKRRYAKGAKKKRPAKPGAKPKAPPEEEQIDMDELRLKVMQDLLEEQKRQNSGE